MTGVFACRAEYRPNPIALTVCKLLAVDEAQGVVRVADIDAYDGTPVVDLKAYFPVCERVKEAHIPAWLSDRPDWIPEERTLNGKMWIDIEQKGQPSKWITLRALRVLKNF